MFVPRIKASHALTTLAANDLSSTAFGSLLDQEVWAISMDVQALLHGNTAGEGPLIIGVAHSDYSAAEIEEWLEEASSWIKANKVGQERAKRKCRTIGTFDMSVVNERMNQGKSMRVKLGFAIEDGSGLQLWGYNEGAAALTTGGVVEITGKAFLAPR